MKQIKIKGIYNTAEVFTTKIDEATTNQIKILVDQPFTKGSKIRIMPDCHAGAGCVIGTTMTIKDKIVPNLVGVDIGCGMLCARLGKSEIDLKALDNFIKANIPCGKDVNKENTNLISQQPIVDLKLLKCFSELRNVDRLNQSMCSLGGGNHFIEIDKSTDGEYYLVIHSGSRNLGKQVAEIYQDKAIKYHESKLFNKKEAIQNAIKQLKDEGRQNEIPLAIADINKRVAELSMPKELCYLEGQDFKDYLYDMNLCQEFANYNRHYMCYKILDYLKIENEKPAIFTTIHNYIDMKNMILRKGAISAYEGELVIIPINMRDGSIIAQGKGCRNYNYSAPHGAGRIMSRMQARKEIKLEDFKETMKGIYSSTINEETLDESPFAYKSIDDILPNIKNTVEVIDIIKPIYNFKAVE